MNVYCPNIKKGCLSIGQNEKLLEEMILNIKSFSTKPIVIKLSPAFVDLAELTKKLIDFGADWVSLFNTFLETKIDILKKKFYFKNKVAGYSGPSIKPLALKLICDVKESNLFVNIIGMSGISNYIDVLEFIIAGVNLVGIGTMNFIYPDISIRIIDDLNDYCIKNNFFLKDLVNSINRE